MRQCIFRDNVASVIRGSDVFSFEKVTLSEREQISIICGIHLLPIILKVHSVPQSPLLKKYSVIVKSFLPMHNIKKVRTCTAPKTQIKLLYHKIGEILCGFL